MYRVTLRRAGLLAGGFVAVWLAVRYVLPLAMPFLAGLLLALAAEPAVRLGTRLKLPRWAATGLGVSVTLLLLICFVGVLGAALVRELGVLAHKLPNLQTTAQQAADKLRILLENAAQNAPDGMQPLVDRSVDRLFSSGSDLVEQATVRLPGAISAFLSKELS